MRNHQSPALSYYVFSIFFAPVLSAFAGGTPTRATLSARIFHRHHTAMFLKNMALSPEKKDAPPCRAAAGNRVAHEKFYLPAYARNTMTQPVFHVAGQRRIRKVFFAFRALSRIADTSYPCYPMIAQTVPASIGFVWERLDGCAAPIGRKRQNPGVQYGFPSP